LPVEREKSPSPLRTASPSPNRIQRLSSSTKAGSFTCAVLPSITNSSTFSMGAFSVRRRTRTPAPLPACSRSFNSALVSAVPSYSAWVLCRSGMASKSAERTARVGSSANCNPAFGAAPGVTSAFKPFASAA